MDEIFKRGTCRHFKELTPVAKEDLLTLVKAGMQARACGNQEAREFIIVTRDDLVKAISHNSLVAGPARKASAAIVIVAALAAKEGYNITFGHFMLKCFPMMLVTLLTSTLYLYVRYFVFGTP